MSDADPDEPRNPFVREMRRLGFPDPRTAPGDQPLAWGGDLSFPRLWAAYLQGIFPWYGPGEPILWWSPDPRFVLYPSELKVPRSLAKVERQPGWSMTVDTCFGDVIRACAEAYRPDQDGTWITSEMVDAYCEMHEMGLAHSVEVWRDGELAGGLYGVAIGRMFYGESMFHRVSNASKVGLVRFVRALGRAGFELIDCQMETPLFRSFGGRYVDRSIFLDQLDEAINEPDPDNPKPWDRVEG